jgi:hypothetical protein
MKLAVKYSAGVVILGITVWILCDLITTPREPTYEGIPYTRLLHGGPEIPVDCNKGIQAIGTNAIPTLIRMLQTKERFWIRNSLYRPSMAVNGFRKLGPAGSPAIPDLVRLTRSDDSVTRLYALICLVEYVTLDRQQGESVLSHLTNDPNSTVSNQANLYWNHRDIYF